MSAEPSRPIHDAPAQRFERFGRAIFGVPKDEIAPEELRLKRDGTPKQRPGPKPKKPVSGIISEGAAKSGTVSDERAGRLVTE